MQEKKHVKTIRRSLAILAVASAFVAAGTHALPAAPAHPARVTSAGPTRGCRRGVPTIARP